MIYDSSVRETASKRVSWAARLCFAAALVLAPVRYGIVLAARPVPAIFSGYTDFLLFAADAAVLGMLALWLVSLCLSPRRLSFGPRYVWIPLAGLTLAGWTSVISSLDPSLSIYHAIRFTVLFWFYVFIVNEVHFAGWVLIPVGMQILSQSIIALAQFVTQRSVHLQSIGELYLDPTRSGISVVAVDGLRLLRAYGLTDHPNILGGCLAFGMLLLLPAYLHGQRPWLALAAILPAGAALLLTFSRSAWLAFLLGTLVLLVVEFANHRYKTLKRGLWLGIAWLLMLLPVFLLYARFFGVRLNAGNSFSTLSAEQQSIGERMLLIETSISTLSAHPVLGIGLGAAPLALKIARPDWPVTLEPPHWAWLDAALETGLSGAAFYLALIIFPFLTYFARRKEFHSDPLAAAVIVALVAITVVGLFDYYTWLLAAGRLWQWLLWSLWALVSTPALLSAPSREHPSARILSTLLRWRRSATNVN